MTRTRSFIQGGFLVEAEKGLDNLKGAMVSRAAVHHLKKQFKKKAPLWSMKNPVDPAAGTLERWNKIEN